MPEHLVHFSKYDVVYQCDHLGNKWLHRYILHDGYRLFAVTAILKPCTICGPYYVIAQTKKEARDRFQIVYGYSLKTKEIRECDQEEQDAVLIEYWKNPRNLI